MPDTGKQNTRAQKTHRSQHNIEGEKVKCLTLPNFKIYYKVAVIKTVCLAKEQTYRSIKQNRDPKNKPMSLCTQLVFDCAGTYNGKRQSLQ